MERTGVSFTNHQCPATMCTSSRSVMVTGLQTADNGMFENCDVRYVGSLSPKIPTVGHMLRKQGYYTAYKGKWHLNADFDKNERTGVRFGLFPAAKMRQAEAANTVKGEDAIPLAEFSRMLTLALMECATSDGGMIA